jgi:hypothetical protein
MVTTLMTSTMPKKTSRRPIPSNTTLMTSIVPKGTLKDDRSLQVQDKTAVGIPFPLSVTPRVATSIPRIRSLLLCPLSVSSVQEERNCWKTTTESGQHNDKTLQVHQNHPNTTAPSSTTTASTSSWFRSWLEIIIIVALLLWIGLFVNHPQVQVLRSLLSSTRTVKGCRSPDDFFSEWNGFLRTNVLPDDANGFAGSSLWTDQRALTGWQDLLWMRRLRKIPLDIFGHERNVGPPINN